ncbi:MAG TPA: FtsX-like permease family protein [Firmicutes bacterium]|nr:FtsX-like permease family protein [Bacillota bacterium]
MLITLKIAFRNISRQKKRSFLLAGAIAFGMLVITLMHSLTGGVVSNIRANFSHALGGHVFIMGREFSGEGRMINKIRPDERLDQLLLENEAVIDGFTKRSQAMPSLIFGSKQTMHLLYGVDFEAEDRLLQSLVVTKGTLANVADLKNSLVLPKPVGERLGVEPGETILVKQETLTGQQNVGEFVVEAFIEDQEQFGLSAAYANRAYLNELMGLGPDEYQMLNMFVSDMSLLDDFARRFREGLRSAEERAERQFEEVEATVSIGGVPLDPVPQREEIRPWAGTRYQVMSINQIMEPVELMVGFLNKVGSVIFLILLLVTMVGITNTFRMIMIERTREIGTMRAFGMQQNQVKHIFLLEAVLLGLLGSAGGVLISGALAQILGRVRFMAAPAMQFFLDGGRITFSFSAGSILLNIALVVATSLIAAYLPARAAAKLSPIKALSSQT